MSEPRPIKVAGGPVSALVTLPGSKSLTIRALTAAGLAPEKSHLYGALSAEDPEAMLRVLDSFGIGVQAGGEPWVVHGCEGRLIAPGHVIDVGESGLTARIALALAALADGETTIDGRGRLRRRPMAPLVETLSSQDVSITTQGGFLPATVAGQGGLWGGSLTVDGSLTSQFATALMLTAPLTREPTSLRVDRLQGSAGYLEMTVDVMRAFGAEVSPTLTGYEFSSNGYRPADFVIEPDASAAVYPLVAAAITQGKVEVAGLELTSKQPDVVVVERLAEMGCVVSEGDSGLVVDASGTDLAGIDTDMSAAPDGALAVIVACLFASGGSRIRGLGSLRHKESDRLAALAVEIGRIGGSVSVDGDSVIISPAPLQPDVIDPHNDHRVAMSLALVGLRLDGLEVAAPDVVNKTWPGYWEALESMTLP